MDIAIQAAIAGILLLSLLFAGRASNDRSGRFAVPVRKANPSPAFERRPNSHPR